MREIDLLPEWYKRDRRQRLRYRTEYVMVGLLAAAICVWNMALTQSVGRIEREVENYRQQAKIAKKVSDELAAAKAEMEKLTIRTEKLELVDSKVDIASILGELSFVMDDRIVLSRVSIETEGYGSGKKERKTGSAGRPCGAVAYRVTIGGVAAESSDVAGLTCGLEDSVYFREVYPTYSRNAIREAFNGSGISRNLNEFEIVSYLANAREVASNK